MTPPPRIAITYSVKPPALSSDDQKSIDALIELPLAGEKAIQLLAELAGLPAEPLLQKFRKVTGARLTQDEERVIVTGGATARPSTTVVSSQTSPDWDPAKTPGQSAEIRTQRSNGYDAFLENHEDDVGGDTTKKVMPRGRARELMSKLKEDSKAEKDILEEIQKQKLKFAEALFDDKKPKK